MNFTREPIIETIVTPREGYKIVVRNTKATHTEEYCVDAVEVVSFGGSFFFRSTERPKCFLVPVTDFELFETKENRVMLKNVGVERVKISGGRENVIKASKESSEREEEPRKKADEPEGDKKRDRRRNRRKRGSEDRKESSAEVREEFEGEEPSFEAKEVSEAPPAPKPRLILPPPALISETISRYQAIKDAAALADAEPKEEGSPKKYRGKPPRKPREEAPAKEETAAKEDDSSTGEVRTLERTRYTDSDYLSSIATGLVPGDTQFF